ncbi:alpha-L-fucosidase [Jiangella aurantiaca]|uniref:alpha-L-fucosidase n=1 Tax=Jiangella aurantiaca TaxID=2530373 RepID=A0A4R5AJJ3_9ACTN|nr:alpha-L-fucosidase [Jiangella aurantiaca]TDD71646.1 alpha-L-fucosidase [Jiangella aurantiaca]
MGVGVFIHFGINTYFGKEWSNGSLPASAFDPTEFDARQWVSVAKDAGAQYLVLTAKHHDGFCLWPTSTTDYSVRSSPWRGGRGDVVAEVAEACGKAGLGLGLYVSPWDRNASCYGDPAAYNDFYVRQLTELCTRYGPLVELWFDGAGSEGYPYDWPRIADVIHRHQPGAMVFNMGAPTIRWVGNENGLAADPVEYVVDHTQMSNYTIVSSTFAEALYLPPECDVSIRRGWFWQQDDSPKDLEHLLGIYYRSVGMGANLLLNLPPNRLGLLDEADVKRVQEWARELDARFAEPIHGEIGRRDDEWLVRFPDEVTLDHLRLSEHLDDGQRVTGHRIWHSDDLICSAGTIGVNRLHVFPRRTVRELRVELTGPGAGLDAVTAYRTGHESPPRIPAGYVAPTDHPED